MDTVVCSICHLPLLPAAFGKGTARKPGRKPCLKCRREAYAVWRANQPVPEPTTTKRCARCKEDKPFDDFQAVLNKKTTQITYLSYCKPCRSIMRSEDWQARKGNDPEGLQEYMHDRAVKYAEYNTEYSKTHRPQINAWKVQNNIDHPEIKATQQARRNTLKRGAAIIDFDAGQWLEILLVFNYRCAYCPPDCLECRKKTHVLEQDHITPVAAGGNYTLHNIVPACRSCNAKKQTGPAPVFVQPLLLTVATSKKKKP